MDELNKNETRLLLYIESRCVDNSGALDSSHLNGDDIFVLKYWNKIGFIKFGRIKTGFFPSQTVSRWCSLSDGAWSMAGKERRLRYDRMNAKKKWVSTEEFNQ